MSTPIKAIEWRDNKVILLDQTLIPAAEEYVPFDSVSPLISAIQGLVVRGAPALGVTGAYGVVVAMDEAARKNWSSSELENAIDNLRDARPTAVNLAWAVEKVRALVPRGRDAVLAAAAEYIGLNTFVASVGTFIGPRRMAM